MAIDDIREMWRSMSVGSFAEVAAVAVAALELLGLLLVAAAAGIAAWTYVGLWAGLLAAGLVVLGGAYLAERNVTPRK